MNFMSMLELYGQDLLHLVSQDLLVPVMLILLAFLVYMLWCIGSLIAEVIMQRRHFKENVPAFTRKVADAAPADDAAIIEESGLLTPQKRALLEVVAAMDLPLADTYAVAKREIGLLEESYQAITTRTDFASKVAPMFGLMGTLIPLGPGIVAMGQGNVEVLSASLLIAFDTTVAGLVVSAVCMLVTRIRKYWYGKYLGAVEATVAAILERARTADDDELKSGANAARDAIARLSEEENTRKAIKEEQRRQRAKEREEAKLKKANGSNTSGPVERKLANKAGKSFAPNATKGSN